jgi:rare lipoprotein A
VRRLFALGLAALLPASCTHHAPPPPSAAHYVLGAPYQAGGVWRYPHEQYDATLTGLAIVYAEPHAKLTTDGETFDPAAMAVAHPNLQLPAIARLTNLETGRQVQVRVNDRGPAAVGRLIAVTPRVALQLGFPAAGIARVRLDVLPAESHAAADALPDAPRLAIATAPREAVRTEGLDTPAPPVAADPPVPPLRMPEQITQMPPDPGRLYVDLSRFTDRRYAARQAARMPGPAPAIEPVRGSDGAGYRARLGPFATIGAADAALDQALRAGVTDARIVVE